MSIKISFLKVFQYFTMNLDILIKYSGVVLGSAAFIRITGMPKLLTISELNSKLLPSLEFVVNPTWLFVIM
jgi:hypothetical protein